MQETKKIFKRFACTSIFSQRSSAAKKSLLFAGALFFISYSPGTALATDTHVNRIIESIESPQKDLHSESDSLTLPELLRKENVPSISIAAIKDFQLHWAKAYGTADIATGRPASTSTRFQAASISKPVTAFAALQMVQSGLLDLDKDINTFLKSWKVPDSELTRYQPVTARSLLSHTSGSDDGFGFPGYDLQQPLPSVLQILDGEKPSITKKVTFARPPYQAYKYSGGGTMIIQQALMDLCVCSFERFMQSRVLEPLKLESSTFMQPGKESELPDIAFAHDKSGRRFDSPWHRYPELAAAGLWRTPTDLAKIMIDIQNSLRGKPGSLLSQQYAKEMITPVGVGDFAVGMEISRRGKGWYFSHLGSNFGFKAWLIGHIRNGYGVVMMTNGDNGMAAIENIANRIARTYGWDSVE